MASWVGGQIMVDARQRYKIENDNLKRKMKEWLAPCAPHISI